MRLALILRECTCLVVRLFLDCCRWRFVCLFVDRCCRWRYQCSQACPAHACAAHGISVCAHVNRCVGFDVITFVTPANVGVWGDMGTTASILSSPLGNGSAGTLPVYRAWMCPSGAINDVALSKMTARVLDLVLASPGIPEVRIERRAMYHITGQQVVAMPRGPCR